MTVIQENAAKTARRYNEAEIRFHVIDPIIRALGYPDGDDVYLNLEEKLEYPYVHIGRRSKKDLPLGFPDYRAGLKGARGSFVVEAKAGSAPISNSEIEQAHSYAAHAQVGANYFVLCNGAEIRVYETLSGPNAPPLAALPLLEVNARFHEIENILSPLSLAKNCRIVRDIKLKLCDRLGSSVRIRGGEYSILTYDYRILVGGQDVTQALKANIPQISVLDEQLEMLRTTFTLRILDGSAERDVDGRITASIQFAGVTRHNESAMQMMGIDHASFVTSDRFLSREPDKPTILESTTDFAVPKGLALPQLFSDGVAAEGDLSGEMFIRTAVYLSEDRIQGEYLALAEYNVRMPVGGNFNIELDLAGAVEMQLDLR